MYLYSSYRCCAICLLQVKKYKHTVVESFVVLRRCGDVQIVMFYEPTMGYTAVNKCDVNFNCTRNITLQKVKDAAAR